MESAIDQKQPCNGVFSFDPTDGFDGLSELREEMRKEVTVLRGGQALFEELEILVECLSNVRSRSGKFYRFNGLVVAYTTGYLTETDVFRMVELFVSTPFRRIGIGDELLGEMLDVSRSLGAISLETVVLPGDAASKSLLEGYGLKARALVMSRQTLR